MLRRNMFMKYYSEASPEGGDGSGAPAEQAKTYTQKELDDILAKKESEFDGLKHNYGLLMDERKEAGRKTKEAEAARILAEQNAAKSSSNMEDFEKLLRSEAAREREALEKEIDSYKGQITGFNSERAEHKKESILGSLSSHFNSPADAEMMYKNIITSFENGKVKTEYTDFKGNVVTTDLNEYVKWMGNNPSISIHMKADAASGGGATGGKQSGGATNFATMSLTEKSKLANENPKLYAQLSGKS